MTDSIASFVCFIRRYDDTPASIATDVAVVYNNNHVIAVVVPVVVPLFVLVAFFFVGILQFDAAVHWRSHLPRQTARCLMDAVASHRSSLLLLLPTPMALLRAVLYCVAGDAHDRLLAIFLHFTHFFLLHIANCCNCQQLNSIFVVFGIAFVVLPAGIICISAK